MDSGVLKKNCTKCRATVVCDFQKENMNSSRIPNALNAFDHFEISFLAENVFLHIKKCNAIYSYGQLLL